MKKTNRFEEGEWVIAELIIDNDIAPYMKRIAKGKFIGISDGFLYLDFLKGICAINIDEISTIKNFEETTPTPKEDAPQE